MSLRTEIARDLAEIERDKGSQTFTWNGAEVPCNPSTERRGEQYDVGGIIRLVDLTLIVRREHFLTADSTLQTIDGDLVTIDGDLPVPLAGAELTFRGRTRVILGATESSTLSHFALDLADPNNAS